MHCIYYKDSFHKMIASYVCVHECVHAYMNNEIKCALLPMSTNERLTGTIEELITCIKTLRNVSSHICTYKERMGTAQKLDLLIHSHFFREIRFKDLGKLKKSAPRSWDILELDDL